MLHLRSSFIHVALSLAIALNGLFVSDGMRKDEYPVRRVELRSPGSSELELNHTGYTYEALPGENIMLRIIVEAKSDQPSLMIASFASSVFEPAGAAELRNQQEPVSVSTCDDGPFCFHSAVLGVLQRPTRLLIVISTALLPNAKFTYQALVMVREPDPLNLIGLRIHSIQGPAGEWLRMVVTYTSYPTAICSLHCDPDGVMTNISYISSDNITKAEIRLLGLHPSEFRCWTILHNRLENATGPTVLLTVGASSSSCGVFVTLIAVLSFVSIALVVMVLTRSCSTGTSQRFRRSLVVCLPFPRRIQCMPSKELLSSTSDALKMQDCSAPMTVKGECDSPKTSSRQSCSRLLPPPHCITCSCSLPSDETQGSVPPAGGSLPSNGHALLHIGSLHVADGGIASVVIGNGNYTVVSPPDTRAIS